MKIPDKVRVGEKLSARWLNQLIDCLKELARAANMAGNGTSTSSIEQGRMSCFCLVINS